MWPLPPGNVSASKNGVFYRLAVKTAFILVKINIYFPQKRYIDRILLFDKVTLEGKWVTGTVGTSLDQVSKLLSMRTARGTSAVLFMSVTQIHYRNTTKIKNEVLIKKSGFLHQQKLITAWCNKSTINSETGLDQYRFIILLLSCTKWYETNMA